MELYIYDTALTLQGVIDKINSLVWIRRYSACGEFKLLVPFTDAHARYLVKNRIVMKRGSDEAAQIKYVHIQKNEQGLEEIEVQGKFLLTWCGKRIIRQQIIATATMQSNLYRIVNENLISPTDAARAIPDVLIDPTDETIEETATEYVSEPYSNALVAIEAAAKAAELGVRVRTDVRAKKHYISVYKGRNLTAEQTENPPCVFSQEFDNVREQEYTNSIENLKTTAYVGGEEKDGQTRKFAEVGSEAEGLEREEVFINATDIAQTYKEDDTEITLTDAQYIARLTDRGWDELKQYAETLGFASAINTNGNLKYGEDYDLGDRVTCINKRWGIRIAVAITEVTETYQAGKEDIDVTFGESLPALIDTIRKIVKG